jgi:hypothetical protein
MPRKTEETPKRNPSTGLPTQNSTHLEAARNARNQAEIVAMVKDMGSKIVHLTWDYSTIDKSDPPPLHGILQIRDMSEEEMLGFFKSLTRIRQNLLQVTVKLGDYPNKKRVDNSKTMLLNTTKPRFPTELAEVFTDIFSDKRYNVVELNYQINAMMGDKFNASGEVYSTDTASYSEQEYFSPVIEIEYIKR